MHINYKRLGYIAIRCKSFDAMRKYYGETLGFKEHSAHCDESGNVCSALMQVSENQYIKLLNEAYAGENDIAKHSPNHFCFEVTNYASVIRNLEAKGLRVVPGPRAFMMQLPEPYEDIKPGMCGSLCAFIQDPEGNDIELMQFTDKSLQKLCDPDFADGGN